MSWHHSRNAVHKRVKRGRTGQIAAAGAAGYYGFTTIGGVNIKGVENDIFLENEIKTAGENGTVSQLFYNYSEFLYVYFKILKRGIMVQLGFHFSKFNLEPLSRTPH